MKTIHIWQAKTIFDAIQRNASHDIGVSVDFDRKKLWESGPHALPTMIELGMRFTFPCLPFDSHDAFKLTGGA